MGPGQTSNLPGRKTGLKANRLAQITCDQQGTVVIDPWTTCEVDFKCSDTPPPKCSSDNRWTKNTVIEKNQYVYGEIFGGHWYCECKDDVDCKQTPQPDDWTGGLSPCASWRREFVS